MDGNDAGDVKPNGSSLDSSVVDGSAGVVLDWTLLKVFDEELLEGAMLEFDGLESVATPVGCSGSSCEVTVSWSGLYATVDGLGTVAREFDILLIKVVIGDAVSFPRDGNGIWFAGAIGVPQIRRPVP